MASLEEEKSVQWKTITSMRVSDGRQYENEQQFNKPATYKIKPIGSYLAVNAEFASIPKQNQLPKLIPNVASLIDEDLNKGFKERQHLISKTNQFTKVLTQHFSDFNITESGTQFVTFRNNINKIMAAPYFHSKPEYDAFAIDIYKKSGIIYLEIVDKSEIINNKNHNDNNDNKLESIKTSKPEWWGTRFENICRHFPDIDSNEDKYEWIQLLESQLNQHKLLMAAEIDCVDENMQKVEIKTQKYIAPKQANNRYSKHEAQRYSKKVSDHRYHPYKNSHIEHKKTPIIPWYKTLKIWIQSYLADVNKILIGFRNENGIMVDVDTLSLDHFSRKISYFNKRNKQKVWKGNICLNFTANVLSFIKDNCNSEDCVYRVLFNEPWKELMLYTQQV